MRTRLPQAEDPGAAIATLLAVCALVCGLFGFGFYKLMEPVQFPNPGLAAYKPPQANIITYPSAAQITHNQPATLFPATNESLSDNAYGTTGRAIRTEPAPQTVEQTPPVALTPAPLEKPPAKKAVAAPPNSTATRKRASG
jgi:hypothetical protein